ncbi:MAG TPA: hypothetical protein VE954_27480 [Oligoflexus sp.]|uniref:hypothetical protein n=1 Tax=Oligoflexus sp. TaxID=1971216 RepID=UPI002D23183A|nr:hypothetical protein [Oligoflexus sp.]HYX36867.1 hypothetical protein [Oligoflexus sp.]
MKIKAVVMVMLAVTLLSSKLIAGGTGGGSGPPAKEKLEEMLMSADMAAAGLFRTETGEINLGINRSLSSEMVLTRSTMMSQALTMSEADFAALSDSQNRTIEAVSVGLPEEKAKSYRVDDGDRLGELILKDRREVARNSVK